MKISTKGRYALRLMLDLAVNGNGEYISIKSISQRQNISEKYLEQIIKMLSKERLVESTRGAQGGYRLKRNEGLHCRRNSACVRGQSCSRYLPWERWKHLRALHWLYNRWNLAKNTWRCKWGCRFNNLAVSCGQAGRKGLVRLWVRLLTSTNTRICQYFYCIYKISWIY